MTATVRPTEETAPPARAAVIGLPAALRAAAADLYFNSWRLAPANLLWGALAIALFLGFMAFPPAAILVPLLAVPVAGIHRMAALIARGEPAAFSDFLGGMRRFGLPALAMGAAASILAVVFTTNVIVGLDAGGPIGWFLSAMALYGDVALAMLLVAFWPVLVDPRRDGVSVRRRLALAGVAVIGRPGRMFVLTVVVGLILMVSTVILAAIVLVSVAFTSLVAARYVLPLVDDLEGRLRA